MLSSLFNSNTNQQPPTSPQDPPPSSSPPSPSTNQQQQQQQQQQPKPDDDPLPELRFIKPNTKYKLLLGGLAFLTFSLITTRRALNKRFFAQIPPFYTSSVLHRPNVNGGMEAFEALNLATLNVISFGMVGSGAAMVALDINRVEDMQRFVRRGFSVDGGDVSKTDQELEEEVAEWVGSVLGKKFEREVRKEQGKNAAAVEPKGEEN